MKRDTSRDGSPEKSGALLLRPPWVELRELAHGMIQNALQHGRDGEARRLEEALTLGEELLGEPGSSAPSD